MKVTLLSRVARVGVRLVSAAGLWLLANVCVAQDWQQNLQLRGFGTLGAVYNNDADMRFVSNLSQTRAVKGGWSSRPDSLLGGQLNWRLNEQWELALQSIIHHHYNDYEPRLTWAYAKYTPSPALSLRAGRIGFDAYMEADSRHVGYGHLPIRQATEYFGFLQLTHLDGADLVYRTPMGQGVLSAKLFAGLGDEKLVPDAGFEYDVEGIEVTGGYLHYRLRELQIRAGVTHAKLKENYNGIEALQAGLLQFDIPRLRQLAHDLGLEEKSLTLFSTQIDWNSGPLQAQLLYSEQRIDSKALLDGYNLYALLGYRIDRLTPYIAHARSDTQGSFRAPGQSLDSPLNQGLRKLSSDQYNWMLGARWDFSANAAFKLQVDFVDAPDALGGIFSGDPDWDGDAIVFSAAIDFVF